LTELREKVALFLRHTSDDHVYWVERSGKTQKNLTLNAAPIDVADFLRRRLFGSGTSVVMTSATLATDNKNVRQASCLSSVAAEQDSASPDSQPESGTTRPPQRPKEAGRMPALH